MTAASSPASSSLAGTWTLLRFLLRRDRFRMPAWVLALALMMVYFANALGTILDEAALQSSAAFAVNPIMALIGGPGYGFDAVTVGKVIVGLYALYLMLGAALMSVLTISRHTCLDEQAGRSELLRGTVVRRHAQLAAAEVLAASMNGVVTALIALAVHFSPAHSGPFSSSLLLGASIGAAGFALQSRRDVAAGLLPDRLGSRHGAAWLGSPLALAFRLQRSRLGWWLFALLLSGVAFGAFAQPMAENAAGLPEDILVIFGGTDGMIVGYLGFMGVYSAILVAVFVILAVQSLRAEEHSGRAEPILAAPTSRGGWLLSWVFVVAMGAVWLQALSGFGEGLGAALSIGEWTLVPQALLGHVAHTPAVWALLGLAVALYGVLPRLIGLAWVFFGYGAALALFGDVLQLNDVVLNSSVFRHIGQYPAQDIAWAAILVLALIAGVLIALGRAGFTRRDLVSA